MNRQEAVALARYVKACCPQQAIDEYTPDAWHDLLGDLDLDACRRAAARVARRQPFVAPAEIRVELQAERRERLASRRSDIFMPHGDTADDVPAYLREVRRRIRAVAGDHSDETATRLGRAGRREPAMPSPQDGAPGSYQPTTE